MVDPPRWPKEQLESDRRMAIDNFRGERLAEPVESYAQAFELFQGRVEHLLDATDDLTKLDSETAARVVADAALLQAFRYVSGPPISEDDLATLAEAKGLVAIVLDGIDRRRFPWVREERKPSPEERHAAVIASAALMAYQHVQTARRTSGKKAQEGLVRAALLGAGLLEVQRRHVDTLAHSPKPGEFCPESKVGTRKADFVVGLWDDRAMPVECKVSNSAINSVKRLNNDAAAKAEAWLEDFGLRNVVPTAILSGVYKLANLEEAQERGLTLFWAHDLPAFVSWIERTRPPKPTRKAK